MKPSGAAIPVETLSALTPDALAMLGDLVAHSGWNQTPQDWAIFAHEGSLFVSRGASGAIIGGGAVLPMGAQVAWISMILVTPAARGKGVGSALFAHCLRAVQAGGAGGRTHRLSRRHTGRRPKLLQEPFFEHHRPERLVLAPLRSMPFSSVRT